MTRARLAIIARSDTTGHDRIVSFHTRATAAEAARARLQTAANVAGAEVTYRVTRAAVPRARAGMLRYCWRERRYVPCRNGATVCPACALSRTLTFLQDSPADPPAGTIKGRAIV